MHKTQSLIESSLSDEIDQLLLRFGGWSTLLALVAGLRRRRRLMNDLQGVPNRIREDIGLPLQKDQQFDILIAAVSANRVLR